MEITKDSNRIVINNDEINALVEDIVKDIQSSSFGTYLKHMVEDDIIKSGIKISNLDKGLLQASTQQPVWQRKFVNTVFQHVTSKWGPCGTQVWGKEKDQVVGLKEPISYIRKAQVAWEKRISKSINTMCAELNVPLAKRRTEKDSKEVLMKWTELSTLDIDLSQYRPVYAAKDFLDILCNLRNPNLTSYESDSKSSSSANSKVIQVHLNVKSNEELQSLYSEMSVKHFQAGLLDSLAVDKSVAESKLAAAVVASGHSAAAREFSKKGCSISLRAALWRIMLGIDSEDSEFYSAQYDLVKQNTLQYSLLTDFLIYKDVKLTASNDDQYFVFEDYLYQVLLPFTRDTHVLERLKQCGDTSPATAYIQGDHGNEGSAVTFPPNGVVPFHGFSMYVAPLCYVYNQPSMLYVMFRTLYTRYFHRLHTLSSHPQGILSLCVLFETRLEEMEPRLIAHFNSIKVQPLRLAFKWLITAFSGYLAVDQVLQLWDRILAYDSVEILAILSVAIFSYRRSNLLKADSMLAAEAVLNDLFTLEIIPLIQLSIFQIH